MALFDGGLPSFSDNSNMMYQPPITMPLGQGLYGGLSVNQGVYGNSLYGGQGVYGTGLNQGYYGSGMNQGVYGGGGLSPWNQGGYKYSSYWVHPKGFLVAPLRFVNSSVGYPSNNVFQSTGAATLDYTIPPTVFGGTVL